MLLSRNASLLWLFLPLLVHAAQKLEPAIQWTFSKAPQAIHFRHGEGKFPIQTLTYPDHVEWYAASGDLLRSVERTRGDSLFISPLGGYVGLQSMELSQEVLKPGRIYSYQIFDSTGNGILTHTVSIALGEHEPEVTLTEVGHLLIAQPSRGNLQEIAAEGTLFAEDLHAQLPEEIRILDLQGFRVGGTGHRLTAATFYQPGRSDSLFTWLRYTGGDTSSQTGGLPGRLRDLTTIPASPYSFLSIDTDSGPRAFLLNELEVIQGYDSGSWKVHPLGPGSAFVITDRDLLVVNLGDGSIAARHRPYDLFEVSDALFLMGPEIFLILRYEPFYRETGELAYRNFELQGMEKNGRIVHRSSFGTWSPVLPTLEDLGRNQFAIHLFNAILVYNVIDR